MRMINYDELPGFFLSGGLNNGVDLPSQYYFFTSMAGIGMGYSFGFNLYATKVKKPEDVDLIETVFVEFGTDKDEGTLAVFSWRIEFLWAKGNDYPSIVAHYSFNKQRKGTLGISLDPNFKEGEWLFFSVDTGIIPLDYPGKGQANILVMRSLCVGQVHQKWGCEVLEDTMTDQLIDTFYMDEGDKVSFKIFSKVYSQIHKRYGGVVYPKLSLSHIRLLRTRFSKRGWLDTDFVEVEPEPNNDYVDQERCLRKSLRFHSCPQFMFASSPLEKYPYHVDRLGFFLRTSCDKSNCNVCYQRKQCLFPHLNFFRSMIGYGKSRKDMRDFYPLVERKLLEDGGEIPPYFTKFKTYLGEYDGSDKTRKTKDIVVSCPIECLTCDDNLDCTSCPDQSTPVTEQVNSQVGGKYQATCQITIKNCIRQGEDKDRCQLCNQFHKLLKPFFNYDSDSCTHCNRRRVYEDPVDKIECVHCSVKNCIKCIFDDTLQKDICRKCHEGVTRAITEENNNKHFRECSFDCEIENCEECYAESTCASCSEGYFLKSKQRKLCTRCGKNCLKCEDLTGKCFECKEKTAVDTSKGFLECQFSCGPNCKTCNQDGLRCSDCHKGYHKKNNGDSTCTKCGENCEKCSNIDGNCFGCPQGMMIDETKKKCVKKVCGSNCQECEDFTGICNVCEPRYYLINIDSERLCLECGENCLSCEHFTGLCAKCSSDEMKKSLDGKSCAFPPKEQNPPQPSKPDSQPTEEPPKESPKEVKNDNPEEPPKDIPQSKVYLTVASSTFIKGDQSIIVEFEQKIKLINFKKLQFEISSAGAKNQLNMLDSIMVKDSFGFRVKLDFSQLKQDIINSTILITELEPTKVIQGFQNQSHHLQDPSISVKKVTYFVQKPINRATTTTGKGLSIGINLASTAMLFTSLDKALGLIKLIQFVDYLNLINTREMPQNAKNFIELFKNSLFDYLPLIIAFPRIEKNCAKMENIFVWNELDCAGINNNLGYYSQVLIVTLIKFIIDGIAMIYRLGGENQTRPLLDSDDLFKENQAKPGEHFTQQSRAKKTKEKSEKLATKNLEKFETDQKKPFTNRMLSYLKDQFSSSFIVSIVIAVQIDVMVGSLVSLKYISSEKLVFLGDGLVSVASLIAYSIILIMICAVCLRIAKERKKHS